MEKLKKIAKYATNILAIVSALVTGINALLVLFESHMVLLFLLQH